MTAWPTGTVPTTNLDAGSDSPAAARADLKTTVDKVNAMIDARGAANGVAGLDGTTKVPIAQLPAGSANGVAELDATGRVPEAQLPFIGFFQGVQVYETHTGSGPWSYSWSIPAGVRRFLVFAVGGGGGGAFRNVAGDGGGGGGAGGVGMKLFTVNPALNSVAIVVGVAGAGGAIAGNNDGVDGGNTTVAYDGILVTGGGGGKGTSGADPKGGGPGLPTNSDANFKGGNGSDAIIGANRGGIGGSNLFTGSGTLIYGSGGTGSGAGAPSVPGQAGGPGAVIILW